MRHKHTLHKIGNAVWKTVLIFIVSQVREKKVQKIQF